MLMRAGILFSEMAVAVGMMVVAASGSDVFF